MCNNYQGKLMSKKFDLAIAIPITVAWLYFLGIVFNQSYFKELGLGIGSLQFGFEEVLLNGFIALFFAGVGWVMKATLLLEGGIFLWMVWGGIKAGRKIRAKIRAASIRATRNRTSYVGKKIADGMNESLINAVRLFLPLIFIIVFFLVAILSGLLSSYQGKASARQVVEKAKKYNSGSHILGFSNGKKISLGPLIGCDDHVCIYLASDRAVVIKRDIINAETAAFPLSK